LTVEEPTLRARTGGILALTSGWRTPGVLFTS